MRNVLLCYSFFIIIYLNLLFRLFTETTNRGPDSDRSSSVEGVSTPSLRFLASFALPDTNHCALHGVLATEVAEVLGMLAHFNLLDLLSQRSPIAGPVFAHNSHFLRSLGLQRRALSKKKIRY